MRSVKISTESRGKFTLKTGLASLAVGACMLLPTSAIASDAVDTEKENLPETDGLLDVPSPDKNNEVDKTSAEQNEPKTEADETTVLNDIKVEDETKPKQLENDTPSTDKTDVPEAIEDTNNNTDSNVGSDNSGDNSVDKNNIASPRSFSSSVFRNADTFDHLQGLRDTKYVMTGYTHSFDGSGGASAKVGQFITGFDASAMTIENADAVLAQIKEFFKTENLGRTLELNVKVIYKPDTAVTKQVRLTLYRANLADLLKGKTLNGRVDFSKMKKERLERYVQNANLHSEAVAPVDRTMETDRRLDTLLEALITDTNRFPDHAQGWDNLRFAEYDNFSTLIMNRLSKLPYGIVHPDFIESKFYSEGVNSATPIKAFDSLTFNGEDITANANIERHDLNVATHGPREISRLTNRTIGLNSSKDEFEIRDYGADIVNGFTRVGLAMNFGSHHLGDVNGVDPSRKFDFDPIAFYDGLGYHFQKAFFFKANNENIGDMFVGIAKPGVYEGVLNVHLIDNSVVKVPFRYEVKSIADSLYSLYEDEGLISSTALAGAITHYGGDIARNKLELKKGTIDRPRITSLLRPLFDHTTDLNGGKSYADNVVVVGRSYFHRNEASRSAIVEGIDEPFSEVVTYTAPDATNNDMNYRLQDGKPIHDMYKVLDFSDFNTNQAPGEYEASIRVGFIDGSENTYRVPYTVRDLDNILFVDPALTWVNDKNHLTGDEKDSVRQKVFEANPSFRGNTGGGVVTVEVNEQGVVTLKCDGFKDTIITSDKTVRERGTFMIDDPVRTLVQDMDHLTDEEKRLVKQAIIDANRNKGFDINDIGVNDDGTATISKVGFKPTVIDRSKTVYVLMMLNIEPPDRKVGAVDATSLTEDEKRQVKENVLAKNVGKGLSLQDITVERNGNVTVRKAGYKDAHISHDKTVYQLKTMHLQVPYVLVEDRDNLTQAEINQAIDSFIRSNSSMNFAPSDFVINEHGGHTRVTKEGYLPKEYEGSSVFFMLQRFNLHDPVKVLVEDKNHLTGEEKEKVRQAIKDANPQEDYIKVMIDVSDTGVATVTRDGYKNFVFTADKTVYVLGQLNVTDPERTLVEDINNLTGPEMEKVKDAVIRANQSLNLERSQISVTNNGTVMITVPNYNIVTIPRDRVVYMLDELDFKYPTRVGVMDINHLTQEEKEQVIAEILKVNAHLTRDNLRINENGSAIITKDGFKVKLLSQNATVYQLRDIILTMPEKTLVEDINRLTLEEREKVERAIRKANPSEEFKKFEIVVSEDGTATITRHEFKPLILTSDKTVYALGYFAITDPIKVGVIDDMKLTDDERQKVVAEIIRANSMLSESDIAVGLDGTATINKAGFKPVTLTRDKTIYKIIPAKPIQSSSAKYQGFDQPNRLDELGYMRHDLPTNEHRIYVPDAQPDVPVQNTDKVEKPQSVETKVELTKPKTEAEKVVQTNSKPSINTAVTQVESEVDAKNAYTSYHKAGKVLPKTGIDKDAEGKDMAVTFAEMLVLTLFGVGAFEARRRKKRGF